MSEKHINKLHHEARKINQRVDSLIQSGFTKSHQDAADLLILKELGMLRTSEALTRTEKKRAPDRKAYYFSPQDEMNTEEYLLFLQNRDLRHLKQARKNVEQKTFKNRKEYLRALEDEIHQLAYFPVMVVSAPHIAREVSADFPGLPTPAMYAMAVLDRYLRTKTFPADMSPEIVGFFNPAEFSDGFIRRFTAEIKRQQPRVICVSNTSEAHYFAIQIAAIVKKHSPNTLVIFGGSHEDGVNHEAYLQPRIAKRHQLTEEHHKKIRGEMTLNKKDERPLVDVVVAGDGQYVLVELMKVVANNKGKSNEEILEAIAKSKELFQTIEGSGNVFVHNRAKQIIETLTLSGRPLDWNTLPFIYHRFPLENRFAVFEGKRTAQIMTKMGCKYTCDFCAESGDLYSIGKPREVGSILQEIEILIRDYGYEAIFFDDSTFTQSPRAAEELVDGIIGLQKQGISFEWGCQTTYTDVPSRELLEKMKKAGCSYVYFGFEQLEEKITGRGAKKLNPSKVEQVLGWCKDIGLRVGTSLQFGLEGMGDYKETIDYIASLRERELFGENCVAININTPYPGTVQWLELVKKGVLPNFGSERSVHPRFETASGLSSLTMEKVDEIYEYARAKLGKTLIGVQFDNAEIQAELEKISQLFAKDLYFSQQFVNAYLRRALQNVLYMNPASIDLRPGEREKIQALFDRLSESEKLRVVERTRSEAADMANVSEEGVVFARNTTEAFALLLKAAKLRAGDRVVATNAENVSMIRACQFNIDHGYPEGDDPWSAYATFYQSRRKKYGKTIPEKTGVETDVVDVVNQSVEQITNNILYAIARNTKVLLVSHVIRDTGVELPVRDIIELARKKKRELNPDDPDLFVVVDGAQALGNLPRVDVKDLGCDAYVGTPSKTMGGATVGLGFFDPSNPKFQDYASIMNKLHWQDDGVVLKRMFADELGIKPNVPDKLDLRDIVHLSQGIEELKALGYADGDFKKIAELRGRLKRQFRKTTRWVIRSYGLNVLEAQGQETDFIYSFHIPGINNRRFVEKLIEHGIPASYIDRTKLDSARGAAEGNGVVRISFPHWISTADIEKKKNDIDLALEQTIKEEVRLFEQEIGKRIMLLAKLGGVAALVGYAWQKARVPIRRVATIASVVLGLMYGNRLIEPYMYGDTIPIDPAFIEASQKSYEANQKGWEYTRRLIKEKGGIANIPWTILDRGYTNAYIAGMKFFLANLGDGRYVTRALRDDFDNYAYYPYSEKERHAILQASRESDNPYLRKLARKIAKPGEWDPDGAVVPEEKQRV